MVGDTLLDSSPSRQPMLRGWHWLITFAAGVAGFCLSCFGLPYAGTSELKVLITQSAVLGVLFFCFALMLCYVDADARHSGFNTGLWLAITFLFNFAGLIVYLIYSAAKTGNWKKATVPIAYMMEILIIGVMVIVPLIYTEALPEVPLMSIWSPPSPPPRAAAAPTAVVQQVSMADLTKEPDIIPATLAMVKDRPVSASIDVPGGVPDGVPGGNSDGPLGDILKSMIDNGTPPPPPKASTPPRIRVSQGVELAKIIYQPEPDYPVLARMARIQGTVRFEALIAKDGTIKGLKVLSGHPLLVQSALAAVQQWRYQPTLLNGQPVEVETEIDVNFTLE